MSTDSQGLLHITHARQDEDWVHGVLVPALGLTDDQVWTSDEADPGALKLEALEEAVKAHRYTLMIVSGAARVDQWAQLAARLAEHLGVEEDKPRLLLAALDCEPGAERARELVPLHQRCLDWFDCSSPERTAAALARLAAQLKVTTTPEPPKECPYPGLRMFGTDAPGSFHRLDLFFGRDEEGRTIVGELRCGGRVLLVGPSGCGKSSLVRARVLPALVQGAAAMAHAIARPGAHPDMALCAALDALDPRLRPATDAYLAAGDARSAQAALAAAASGRARLLFLDQFEEAFHHSDGDGGEHARFYARLAALGRVPGLALLLSMRADFYGDLMHSPAWDDFKDHRVELAPLRGAALHPVITRPAEAVGVYVEPDLVERLVREADQDRAAEALPLLQVALEQLWPLRQWRYLSLASYERLADGDRRGLDVVLARHADACIRVLPEPEQVLARRVLIDLVQLGEGRPDTRRRRTVGELRRAGDDARALAHVLDHLAQQRLIVISADAAVDAAALPAMAFMLGLGGSAATERHVDLAHDTLITGWPALTGWIAKRRDDLRTQRRLETRAAAGGLLAASELPELTRWVAHVATPEGKAIGASEALLALVRRSVAARRARRIALAAGLVALIAVLSAAAAVSLWQRGIALDNAELANFNAKKATEQGEIAQKNEAAAKDERDKSKRLLVLSAQTYQETGRQLLLEGRVFESVPYLVEARRAQEETAPGAENESLQMLFSEATRRLPVMWKAYPNILSGALSPDGTRILTVKGSDSTVLVLDVATGKPLSRPLQHPSSVFAASFSPDGARIVTVSQHSSVHVWDIDTGKLLGPRIDLYKEEELLVHKEVSIDRIPRRLDAFQDARLSPDGNRVVTVSRDRVTRVWSIATGKPLAPPLAHQGKVFDVAFSLDDIRIVTAEDDHHTRVWDAISGAPLAPPLRHLGKVSDVAFSPDGSRIVTAEVNHDMGIYDAISGKPLGSPLKHQAPGVVQFSSDGTRVITVSANHTARVWDVATGKPLSLPLGHGRKVIAAALSANGNRFVSVSLDGAIIKGGIVSVWDIANDNRPSAHPHVFKHRRYVKSAAFSLDSTRVVIASEDKSAGIWDTSSGKLLFPPLKHEETVNSAVFSPDGTRIVTASDDKTARIWDVSTGNPIFPPLEHQGSVYSAAFSPDGARVVTASSDKTARVWDTSSGKQIFSPLEHQGAVYSAAFSPDGTRVVTASNDKTARIWDISSGQLRSLLLVHDETVRSAKFSLDGTLVITASDDQTAHIWNAFTGNPHTPPLTGVSSAEFSPDGTRVASSSQANIAHIWDASTGEPLSSLRESQVDSLEIRSTTDGGSAEFSPDGTRVVTASYDKAARIWDASTGKPLCPPLVHGADYDFDYVKRAKFSPDGTRVLTWNSYDTYVWSIPLDRRSLADWEAALARTPYVLVNGAISLRRELTPPSSPP